MAGKILDKSSLATTLWNLEKIRTNNTKYSQKEIDEALNWIIKQQKKPARYGLCFAAPTDKDYNSTILPTGEKMKSRACTAHLLGEEAFWALAKWRGPDATGVKIGLTGMLGRAGRYPASADKGRYCCSICSLAFWRALRASGLKEGQYFIERGLSTMSLIRDSKRGWKSFQFGYSIFALSSLEHPLADKELKYAGGRIERSLKHLRASSDPHGLRMFGFEQALSRV